VRWEGAGALTKPQTKEFDYRVEKLGELSAMGGFPVTREAAEQDLGEIDFTRHCSIRRISARSGGRIGRISRLSDKEPCKSVCH
jgi:hypothetical protein